MNLTQMHERLRQELLRRIQRGTLSVSLLARQTGLCQSHVSNFLRRHRRLSLASIDRILAAQQLSAHDLFSAWPSRRPLRGGNERNSVPIVSHAVALFEPVVRPSAVQSQLHLSAGVLQSLRARPSSNRQSWERFVAVRIPSADALAMDPLVLPEAVVLLDRHYNSLRDYRPSRPSLYAVRHGAHLRLRYADFQQNRLILRPLNIAFAVELVEIEPGEAPNDLLAGRVALILNEI